MTTFTANGRTYTPAEVPIPRLVFTVPAARQGQMVELAFADGPHRQADRYARVTDATAPAGEQVTYYDSAPR